jgi:hypothetical protein
MLRLCFAPELGSGEYQVNIRSGSGECQVSFLAICLEISSLFIVLYHSGTKTFVMAKLRDTIIRLRGKFGDYVLVESKNGAYARRRVAPGTKKNELALKQQYDRAAYLNKLASELNSIIKEYCGIFTTEKLYQNILKRFRKEPLNNRFLLLKQLEGMEMKLRYRFSQLGHCNIAVRKAKNKTLVSLTCIGHPLPGKFKADCYYYDLLLLTWSGKKNAALRQRKRTEWISLKEDLDEFVFRFASPPGVSNWLLCMRQRLGVKEKKIEGVKEKEIESYEAEGVVIKAAGSFVKKELEMLEMSKKNNRDKIFTRKQEEEIERVKAKRRPEDRKTERPKD